MFSRTHTTHSKNIFLHFFVDVHSMHNIMQRSLLLFYFFFGGILIFYLNKQHTPFF